MAIGFAIKPALELLKQHGIEGRPLLIRAGLSEEHTDYALRRVPAAAQARFLEYAAEALGDGALGLHIAAAGDPRSIGLVFYVGAAARTLGEAMQLMTRYVSIADECASLNLAPQPDGVALEYKFVGLSRHLLKQQSEFALAMGIKAMRFATGRELRPVRVRFAHVRTSDLKDFVRFFGCPVEFNAPSDHLVFSRETVALPLITADPQLLVTLHPICEAEAGAANKKTGSLRASVESEVQRLLPQGHANIETVAKALGLSARTLSRNLAAEGSAFTEIMDQLRHTLALQYLKEPNLPLTQIAWLLGYANPTSFTHAFRRRAGRPPSAVRKDRSPREPSEAPVSPAQPIPTARVHLNAVFGAGRQPAPAPSDKDFTALMRVMSMIEDINKTISRTEEVISSSHKLLRRDVAEDGPDLDKIDKI